jgi:hypothetical protein
MKVQEVMLRAMARKITWYQAAEILGISDRHMRRWRERYEEFGYDGLPTSLETFSDVFELPIPRGSVQSGWNCKQDRASEGISPCCLWTRMGCLRTKYQQLFETPILPKTHVNTPPGD